MFISPGRRLIFVHIPKTGGTSMTLALEARAMASDLIVADTPKGVRRRRRLKGLTTAGRLWKHSRLSDIRGLAQAEPLDAFFVFTMVRDPWDRLLSLYAWLRNQSFDHPSAPLAKRLEFNDFLRNRTVRAMLSRDGADEYVTDAAGRLRCNAFVRLEHLDADLAPVEAHLGFALRPLPHVNRSDRAASAREAYDPDMAAAVADWFRRDIDRFGYRF